MFLNEAEMFSQQEKSMFNHKLFTESSLDQIDEKESKLEQSILEKERYESKKVMESYARLEEYTIEMIERCHK